MMKNIRTLGLLSVTVLIAALATGCGASNTTTAVKAMKGLTSQIGGSTNATVLRQQLAQYRMEAAEYASRQALVSSLGTQSLEQPPQFLGGADSDYSCTFSSGSASSSSFTMSCTNNAADTFSCGSTSYTWNSGGTIGMTFTTSGTTFTFSMNFSGTLTGGEFGTTGSAISCRFGYTFNQAQLQSGTGFDLTCSDTNFACTVGGATIGCADLESTYNASGASCS